MNNVEKKFSKYSITFISVATLITFFLNTRVSNNGVFITFAPFIMSSVLIIIFLTVPFVISVVFKHIMVLIDDYTNGILSGKKFTESSDSFYCQVCKSKVDADDIYCSSCGMTM